MRTAFVFLAAIAALWTSTGVVAQDLGSDSLDVVDAAAVGGDAAGIVADPDNAAAVAAVLPLPAPPAPPAVQDDIGGARVVVIATDADAIRAVGQLREGVHARDWGVVVGVGCLLVVFLLVRLVLPHLHGTAGVRIVAGVAGLCGYVGAQVGPGSSIEDIIATVMIGAVLSAVAVWSPPSGGSGSSSGASGGGAAVLLLVCLASMSCGSISPQTRQDLARAGVDIGACLAECGLRAGIDAAQQSLTVEGVDGPGLGTSAVACATACAAQVGLTPLVELARDLMGVRERVVWCGTSSSESGPAPAPVYRVRLVAR